MAKRACWRSSGLFAPLPKIVDLMCQSQRSCQHRNRGQTLRHHSGHKKSCTRTLSPANLGKLAQYRVKLSYRRPGDMINTFETGNIDMVASANVSPPRCNCWRSPSVFHKCASLGRVYKSAQTNIGTETEAELFTVKVEQKAGQWAVCEYLFCRQSTLSRGYPLVAFYDSNNPPKTESG